MISSILPDIASSKERALETASMVQLQVPIGAAISDYGTKEPPPFSGNVESNKYHIINIEKFIPVGISGQQKADFRPDHRLDSATCISLHGTDQLETQCTISQL